MVQHEINKQEFAERLSKAAEHAGYFGHGMGIALAKLFKVTPKAVSKWLNAEAMPNRERIGVIAKALGVSRLWLEYGTGAMIEEATQGHHLEAILDLGLSEDNLRLVEDYARLLKLKETSQN